MRLPSRLRTWRLESLALVAAYSTVVLAQGNGNNNNNDDDEEEQDNAPTQTRNTPQPTNDSDDNDNNNNDNQEDEEETTTEERRTSTRQETRDATTSTESTTSTRTTRSRSSETDTESPTSSVATDYSYPPAAVPPTINAPFMDRSTMPDGTVFIAVGAILGTFGLAILVWRGIVACLLHRSVARAAAAQHIANEKSTHLPPAGVAKKSKRKPSSSDRGTRRTPRGPVPSSTPSQSNLFFSPTAAGTAAMGSNRDSRYLPSGFYAAGSSPSPAVNYSSLRPDSRGQQYSRNTLRDVSPEGSPQYAVRQQDPSMSSLNLSQAPGQRAPSAYLDDLLDENPHMFPPPQMPAQASRHHHSNSYSSQGRH